MSLDGPSAHDDRGIMLPFYLLCDVSYSMNDDGKIDAVNEITPAVADALAKNPILSDKVRFSLLDFSGESRTVIPMRDLLEENRFPRMECRTTGTSFAAAFAAVRQAIETDVKLLKDDGFRVHRPAVFFLSDGAPTDEPGEWERAFRALTEWDAATGQGFRWHPVVVPFGVQGADRQTMASLVRPVGRSHLYMTADGQDAASAIKEMAEVLIISILKSGQTAVNQESGIQFPAKEEVGPSLVVDDDWL